MIPLDSRKSRDKNKTVGALAATEYILLIVIILVSLYVFRTYLVRGLSGKWKDTGDSFGVGRQFDPAQTTQCAFDTEFNKWYDTVCFDNHRCNSGDRKCVNRVISTPPPKGCMTLLCQREAFDEIEDAPVPFGESP